MTEPTPPSAAVVLMRQAQHVLFVGLLLIGVVQTVVGRDHGFTAGGVAAGILAWYGYGAVLTRRRPPDRRVGVLWVAVLCVGWAALVALSADFVWLLFAIFLLLLQILPLRWAIPAVAGLTGIGVLAVAAHQGRFTAAGVIGPLIGATVTVVISMVYAQLRQESERRAQVVAELTAAQDRLAAAERYAGTVAERERLAHELHDTLAQSLSSIVILLRSVREQAAALPAGAHRQLDVAAGAARDALEHTRRLVRTLEPSGLAGQPLTTALQRLVEDTAAVGIDVGLEVDGEPYDLPTTVAVALLRTAQGALGNVVAHSMAAHARVTLTFQPGRVILDVADDGQGFDTTAPRTETTAGTGIGLAAMRKRLAAAEGTLTVESTPGGGTAISASIPVEACDD
ncbi:sensor histidine kinase [Micromonospora chersina]|uniref:sensor histidine kinase n=1 Tax=Micromonospora chersina TaxID=47854 RepID=UPI0036C432A6